MELCDQRLLDTKVPDGISPGPTAYTRYEALGLSLISNSCVTQNLIGLAKIMCDL